MKPAATPAIPPNNEFKSKDLLLTMIPYFYISSLFEFFNE